MDNLDLNPRILIAIRKAKLQTFGQILSLSAPDLERATQLSLHDVVALQKTVARAVKPEAPLTALQLYKKQCPKELAVNFMTCICPVITAFLKGGIPTRGITEVAGESATGKTQLCLQLCIAVQLPLSQHGLESGVIYICTEDVFPNKRLIQMVNSQKNRLGIKDHSALTDNIFIEHASEIKDLRYCISKKVPILLSQGRVQMIVIDSIAALFRCEYEAHETVRRAKELSSFAAQLHQLSFKYCCPVICVNQVTDVVHSTTGLTSRRVIPSLGLAWSNLVTTRIMLTKTDRSITLGACGGGGGEGGVRVGVRQMEVIFAPHLPNRICEYVIDTDGVKGLS